MGWLIALLYKLTCKDHQRFGNCFQWLRTQKLFGSLELRLFADFTSRLRIWENRLILHRSSPSLMRIRGWLVSHWIRFSFMVGSVSVQVLLHGTFHFHLVFRFLSGSLVWKRHMMVSASIFRSLSWHFCSMQRPWFLFLFLNQGPSHGSFNIRVNGSSDPLCLIWLGWWDLWFWLVFPSLICRIWFVRISIRRRWEFNFLRMVCVFSWPLDCTTASRNPFVFLHLSGPFGGHAILLGRCNLSFMQAPDLLFRRDPNLLAAALLCRASSHCKLSAVYSISRSWPLPPASAWPAWLLQPSQCLFLVRKCCFASGNANQNDRNDNDTKKMTIREASTKHHSANRKSSKACEGSPLYRRLSQYWTHPTSVTFIRNNL